MGLLQHQPRRRHREFDDSIHSPNLFDYSLQGLPTILRLNEENPYQNLHSVEHLIKALQTGGSRSKMEAAITVRTNVSQQAAFVSSRGIPPLVHMLTYEADEVHWPPEMRQKATITVRAEASLVLASLAVSSDDNKRAIGEAGAIPLLCRLLGWREPSLNQSASLQQREMHPFFVLARDAAAGALSCLAKDCSNQMAIMTAQALPMLVQIIDQGTPFGRAAAANVLAKLATGDSAGIKASIRREGAIPALIRLLQNGSCKAREAATEALANLAMVPQNKSKIMQEGGLSCLLKMQEQGPEREKSMSAFPMRILCSDTPAKHMIENEVRSVSREKGNLHSGEIESADAEDLQVKESALETSLIGHQKGIFGRHCNVQELDNMPFIVQSNLTTATHACGFSELTTSFTPPLWGQASIQAGSIISNALALTYQENQRKRMKMVHTSCDVNILPGEYAVAGRPNSQQRDLDHDGMPGIRREEACAEGLDIFKTCSSLCDGKQMSRMEEIGLHVHGGISALVSALLSSNPGAQEFASLALMLLATQGGPNVKTAIGDAGALDSLVRMASSSDSSLIRESAAAAITKLVSCHSKNRLELVRADGVRALVNIARSSLGTVPEFPGKTTLGHRIRTAALVALLSISEASDHKNTNIALRSLHLGETLPSLARMLEKEDHVVLRAAVDGIQALASLYVKCKRMARFEEVLPKQECLQEEALACMLPEIGVIGALVEVIRGGSHEAKGAAATVLREINESNNDAAEGGAKLEVIKPTTTDNAEVLRRHGVTALVRLLDYSHGYMGLVMAGTVACLGASDKLCPYVEEDVAVPGLMRLLQGETSLLTKVASATAIANIGSTKKKITQLTKCDTITLVELLGTDSMSSHEQKAHKVQEYCFGFFTSTPHFCSIGQSPTLVCVLQEHIASIVVYAALSGETMKEELVAAGGVPILVKLLNACNIPANRVTQAFEDPTSPMLAPRFSANASGPLGGSVSLATQEFALMALILLADKSTSAIEAIVEAGGIIIILKLLSITNGGGKLGASWSEMAAAALLTMASCDAARNETVRVGGVSTLVSVLSGETGSETIPCTSVAAMAQLIGVLALNSQDAKIHISQTGAVRCLVEILTGGGCLRWDHQKGKMPAKSGGSYALAQEAAAAALANVVLQSSQNARAAVEAGAIGPLVRMVASLHLEGKIPSIAKPGISVTLQGSQTLGNENNTLETKDPLKAESTEGETSSNLGAPLAAMAALGNLITSYPPCRQDVVKIGGFTKVAAILQGMSSLEGTHQNGRIFIPSDASFLGRIQGSALLLMGLLSDGAPGMQNVMAEDLVPSAT